MTAPLRPSPYWKALRYEALRDQGLGGEAAKAQVEEEAKATDLRSEINAKRFEYLTSRGLSPADALRHIEGASQPLLPRREASEDEGAGVREEFLSGLTGGWWPKIAGAIYGKQFREAKEAQRTAFAEEHPGLLGKASLARMTGAAVPVSVATALLGPAAGGFVYGGASGLGEARGTPREQLEQMRNQALVGGIAGAATPAVAKAVPSLLRLITGRSRVLQKAGEAIGRGIASQTGVSTAGQAVPAEVTAASLPTAVRAALQRAGVPDEAVPALIQRAAAVGLKPEEIPGVLGLSATRLAEEAATNPQLMAATKALRKMGVSEADLPNALRAAGLGAGPRAAPAPQPVASATPRGRAWRGPEPITMPALATEPTPLPSSASSSLPERPLVLPETLARQQQGATWGQLARRAEELGLPSPERPPAEGLVPELSPNEPANLDFLLRGSLEKLQRGEPAGSLRPRSLAALMTQQPSPRAPAGIPSVSSLLAQRLLLGPRPAMSLAEALARLRMPAPAP